MCQQGQLDYRALRFCAPFSWNTVLDIGSILEPFFVFSGITAVMFTSLVSWSPFLGAVSLIFSNISAILVIPFCVF